MVHSADTVVTEAARPLALQRANGCTTVTALQPESGYRGTHKGPGKAN